MNPLIERLDARIAELKTSLERVNQQANAHLGAIQELERWKASEEKLQNEGTNHGS